MYGYALQSKEERLVRLIKHEFKLVQTHKRMIMAAFNPADRVGTVCGRCADNRGAGGGVENAPPERVAGAGLLRGEEGAGRFWRRVGKVHG